MMIKNFLERKRKKLKKLGLWLSKKKEEVY